MKRAVILTLALAVGACGSSATVKLQPEPQILSAASQVESPIIAGQHTVVATPRTPTDRAIIFMHGANEGPNFDFSRPLKAPMIAAALRAGYVWADSDAGHNNWGNAASVRDNLALIAWLRARGYRRLFVVGASMGGLDSLEVLRDVRPAAWAGIYPVCNLRSVTGRFGSAIDTAGHVRGLPMIFWASPQDTVVPKRENTDMCAAAASRNGALVTVIPTHGQHGDPSNYQPARLLAFFAAAR
jgi:hypothetical protein